MLAPYIITINKKEATKLIVPSDMQNLAATVAAIKEAADIDKE